MILNINNIPLKTRALLEKLSNQEFMGKFYLAGGTAAALFLGHRRSDDLDFFSEQEFNSSILIKNLKKIGKFEGIKTAENTLIGRLNGIKISFFTLPYKFLKSPVEYKNLFVAQLEDLATMKILAISDRGTKRDFIDLYFLCQKIMSFTDGAIDSTYKYAWSENTGWINFGTTNGGVIINSSGEFTGSALGENVGWIIFGGDYKVKTDWRPRSARPACNNSLDDDGDGKTDYPADPGCSSLEDTDETDVAAAPSGGGGMPVEWYNPPKAPEKGFSVLINNNAEYTNTLTVALNLRGGSDTEKMVISNFSDFRDAGQETYTQTKDWNLCQGQEDICKNLGLQFQVISFKFSLNSMLLGERCRRLFQIALSIK